MRIASLFQRCEVSARRRRRALGVSIWGALITFGCFFELEPLAETGGLGGGGTFGAVGGEGGDAPIGGGGAGIPVSPGCAEGQKRCAGVCVAYDTAHGCGDPACLPCADVPNATTSCSSDTGQCRIGECDPGFADCNGDTASYSGQAGGDGCEYNFAAGTEIRASGVQPLEVPRANGINIGDDSRDDWDGVPAYQLSQPCNEAECDDDALPEVTAISVVPPRSDLDAYFRVAWGPDFFYVLADVYDGTLISNGADNQDGRCQNGALCEDALTVFFDGRNNRTQAGQEGYGFDDPRIFLGLGGQAYRVSGALQPGDVDLKPFHGAGPACYRIEAQIAWNVIVGVDANGNLPGQFPPAPGQSYGFDISVNDWDKGISDQVARRESHLFWLNPGPNYHFKTTGFGAMTLVEQVAPVTPQ